MLIYLILIYLIHICVLERKIPDEEYKQVIPDLDEYTKVSTEQSRRTYGPSVSLPAFVCTNLNNLNVIDSNRCIFRPYAVLI